MLVRWAVALVLFATPIACKRAEPPATAPAAAPASASAVPGAGSVDAALASETVVVSGHGESLPVERGDLPAIRERGTLRVLTQGGEGAFLPRAGSSVAQGRALVAELARRHGLRARFLLVQHHDDLLPLLSQGKADLAAAELTVTAARAASALFTRPTATVSELLIGKKGDASAPKSIADLAGREVHVRASSSYAETLRALVGQAPGLKVVAAPEHLDSEALVYEVTRGLRPLTVVDSHLFAGIATYNPAAQALFPLATGRQVAWAVRKDAPGLKAVADALLLEKAVSAHTEELDTGDLDALRKRGSLRVLIANNAVNYFLHRGQQFGFEYELCKMFAESVGLRLEVVVPPSRELLFAWLKEGKGDLIAASVTVTPARQKEVAFSKPYLYTREVLVEPKGSAKITSLEGLKGKLLHVRRSSSYRETLLGLQEKYGPFTLVDAPETMETEQLIRRVASGAIPATVADSYILDVERAYRSDAEGTLTLAEAGAPRGGEKPIAFALRPQNGKLREALDAFVAKVYRGIEYNMAHTRYFKSTRTIAMAKESQGESQSNISRFDDIMKKHSAAQNFDWRLVAAQAYQESRFDPNAKSFAGAMGLFQVLPTTAKELGISNLIDPDEGTRAGVTLLTKMLTEFEPRIPLKHRVRFALAAYNAGKGHVQDARRIAGEMGLNVDKWFGHVEKAMLLLQDPAYHSKARYGYCRGAEPVKYVSQIQNRYDNYIKLIQR